MPAAQVFRGKKKANSQINYFPHCNCTPIPLMFHPRWSARQQLNHRTKVSLFPRLRRKNTCQFPTEQTDWVERPVFMPLCQLAEA